MTEPHEPARTGTSAVRGVLPLVGLYLLSVVTYALLSRVIKVPLIFPDEFTYGHIAQSLAAGEGVAWRGQPLSLHSLLYVLAIAPSWVVSSGYSAYEIAKTLNAAMASLVVVPVWLVARPLVGARLALVPALLTVAGSWMLSTGVLLSESLAFPLTVASLACMVTALRSPGSRWWIWSLILAALAAYARLQLVALVPILILALLLDVARVGASDRRARLRAHRWPLALTAGATLVGLIVALADPAVLGIYASVRDFSPGLGKVLGATGQHALALIVISGFVPAVAVIALALRPANWRDDATGPLLAVLLSATLVLVVQSGWFGAGFHLRWDIERYVAYVIPLAFVALMLLPGRVSLRAAAGTGVALALCLLLVDRPINRVEQRGVGGTVHRLGQIADTFASHAGLGLALLCVLVGIGGALLVLHPPRALSGGGGLLVVAGLVLAVLLVQSQESWHTEHDISQKRRDLQPADISWVDHLAKGKVGILNVNLDNPNVYLTEFFNEKIRGRYHVNSGLAALGTVCVVSVQEDGSLRGPEGCTPPRYLLLESSFARLAFDGGRVLGRDLPNSKLVDAGVSPRLLSDVTLSCLEKGAAFKGSQLAVRPCTGLMGFELWPNAPATLIVRFRGGATKHYGRLQTESGGAGRVYGFAPGQITTIRIPVGPDPQRLGLQLDWRTTAGAPTVQSVQMQRGSQVSDLL